MSLITDQDFLDYEQAKKDTLSKLKPCPFCKGTNLHILPNSIICANEQCCAEGPIKPTIADAVNAWNKGSE